MVDVLVIGGGNAGLCAALAAREAGASVLLVEAAPRAWRGGNSQHARDMRCMHDSPQDVLVGAYSEAEYWQDLLKVTAGVTDEKLARIVIRASSSCRDWMRGHGVHFQPPLSGARDAGRTNAFLLGGGKALINAYYRSCAALGIALRYDAPVEAVELEGTRFIAARIGDERIEACSCVLAAGGSESNHAWLREAWGQVNGQWVAENFSIRGTRYNMGVLLRYMINAGADSVSDPSQAHCVAIDARMPRFDSGICSRVDCVPLGIVVNRDAQRFYDEGEDFWAKRYAIWGRLIAQQPGQIGYSVIDSKAIGHFMPPVFPGAKAYTLDELARKIGLDEAKFVSTIETYNAACQAGTSNFSVLDDCRTEGLAPPKTHWARAIDRPPFYAYALRPGITFTYLGLKTDENAAVIFGGNPSPNLFVAGEMMSGNLVGKGYMTGVGMAIGTAFGRIAGRNAASAGRSLAQLGH